MKDVFLTVKLADLAPDERALVEWLLARAKSHPRRDDFENFLTEAVVKFYGSLDRGELQKTAGYQVGSDLAAHLAITESYARIPDYRDELAEIIRRNFPTRRKFCVQAGLSETMLSQVLSDQKHLSIDALIETLARIDYQLHLLPRDREVFEVPDVNEPTNDSQLLFEVVKSFRTTRDRYRISGLAKALGLEVSVGENPALAEVEKFINRLGGKSFGSFEANHMAAQEIQGLLKDLGLHIVCPKLGCQAAATLHHTKGQRMKHGMFVFVHPSKSGQAHHGGWANLPETMSLVATPVRRKCR